MSKSFEQLVREANPAIAITYATFLAVVPHRMPAWWMTYAYLEGASITHTTPAKIDVYVRRSEYGTDRPQLVPIRWSRWLQGRRLAPPGGECRALPVAEINWSGCGSRSTGAARDYAAELRAAADIGDAIVRAMQALDALGIAPKEGEIRTGLDADLVALTAAAKGSDGNRHDADDF